MAATYEDVWGELPQSPGGGRLWPVEAVERLGAARSLIAAGRARSIRDGLDANRPDAQRSVEPPAIFGRDTKALEVIAARLAAVERLEHEVQELRREVGELRALPPALIESPDGTGSVHERVARADDETFYGYRIRDKDHRPESNDGVLVRLARRLERLLGRDRLR
jgi:hypothetical protein